jgi:undecaprenyl diphosphate synthase
MFMKNSESNQIQEGLHVAIIMDGNGRWATRQGKPRFYGHQAGAETVRKIVEVAPDNNISVLTLYAFSSDNWQRPKFEVNVLMNLFRSYLQSEVQKCIDNGVKLSIIGRRDRLNPTIVRLMESAEEQTANGNKLHLRVAIDYSARDTILAAAKKISPNQNPSREEFSRMLCNQGFNYTASPDVDLLIRTGGEQRLSDFLLWECAYAELYFTRTMWPDFSEQSLRQAMQKFRSRERRFGQIPQVQAMNF